MRGYLMCVVGLVVILVLTVYAVTYIVRNDDAGLGPP